MAQCNNCKRFIKARYAKETGACYNCYINRSRPTLLYKITYKFLSFLFNLTHFSFLKKFEPLHDEKDLNFESLNKK